MNKSFGNSPILIIPFWKNISESLKIAEKYDVGFEYNEFAMPWVLDDEQNCENLILNYKSLKNLPFYTTTHGAFFDVLVFSDDERIRKVSELRVRQSLNTAQKLGCRGIVFHGNINPLLLATAAGPSYERHWLETTRDFFRTICSEYPDIDIYIENMWDRTPDNLANLAKEMKDIKNFGLCFDYAHAHISPTDPEIWSKMLGPYIRHVHINDNDGKADLHLALGKGITDWNKFMNLRERDFPHSSILIETSSPEAQIESLEFISRKF